MTVINASNLNPATLRKGDVIDAPRGRFIILRHSRKKKSVRLKGEAWKYAIVRTYDSLPRVFGQ